ncbi:diacylglycerol acyltransferase [Cardiosporidium cionae]|uniref:Diacylglycerol acyltransferase n=1 Tax=Cardiosporidium cionae TaxID=476202 RepID=A0ABQ7J8K4_9APIC|nr:diacylglycerol acyltransferase [Cardiosporidium cionae]|eukprot:KAF8820293.1 diacylglycerol acyltransferase [Cardiosporidium cionae]
MCTNNVDDVSTSVPLSVDSSPSSILGELPAYHEVLGGKAFQRCNAAKENKFERPIVTQKLKANKTGFSMLPRDTQITPTLPMKIWNKGSSFDARTFQDEDTISCLYGHSEVNQHLMVIPAILSPEQFIRTRHKEKCFTNIFPPLQRLMVLRYPAFVDADVLFTEPWRSKWQDTTMHIHRDKILNSRQAHSLHIDHLHHPAALPGKFSNAAKFSAELKSPPSSDSSHIALTTNPSCRFMQTSMADREASKFGENFPYYLCRKTLFPLPYASLLFWDEFRAMALCFGIMGSFFYVPFALYCFYRKFCTTKVRKVAFFAVLFLFTVIPLRSSRRVRLWNGWKVLHQYHQISTIVEESHKFPPREATLYPVMPHGIIPIAQGAVCTLGLGEFLKSTRLALATIVSYIPLYGHVCQLFGSLPATKGNIRKALEEKENVVLIPGGIAEIYDTNQRTERIRLRNRNGFLKLAIETGANVVPIYCFGNSHCFRLLPGFGWLRPVARMLRLALVFFVGRLGLPIPFKVPLLFIIGRCMNFGQKSNPTHLEIENAHRQFVSEVKRLFNTYKSVYGWDHKKIEIT